MDDEILFQGPGYTIARSQKAETLVPYFEAERENGDVNYGWFDLRGHPEAVLFVPEAAKNKGLADLLRVMAHPSSKIMSSACECGLFKNTNPDRPRWYAGGFVTTMFQDAEKNTDPKNLIELAQYILGGIEPTNDHQCSYEFFIEPLKHFFGRTDCYALTIKPFGHHDDEKQAWEAFQIAGTATANAIQRGRKPEERLSL